MRVTKKSSAEWSASPSIFSLDFILALQSHPQGQLKLKEQLGEEGQRHQLSLDEIVATHHTPHLKVYCI